MSLADKSEDDIKQLLDWSRDQSFPWTGERLFPPERNRNQSSLPRDPAPRNSPQICSVCGRRRDTWGTEGERDRTPWAAEGRGGSAKPARLPQAPLGPETQVPSRSAEPQDPGRVAEGDAQLGRDPQRPDPPLSPPPGTGTAGRGSGGYGSVRGPGQVLPQLT